MGRERKHIFAPFPPSPPTPPFSPPSFSDLSRTTIIANERRHAPREKRPQLIGRFSCGNSSFSFPLCFLFCANSACANFREIFANIVGLFVGAANGKSFQFVVHLGLYRINASGGPPTSSGPSVNKLKNKHFASFLKDYHVKKCLFLNFLTDGPPRRRCPSLVSLPLHGFS